MDFDTRVKLAIYRFTADTTQVPSVSELGERLEASDREIRESYQRLFAKRVLVLEPDGVGVTIRMAPPFSGVPTTHLVRVGEKEYFANCAWDALGILAALRTAGTVLSRCEQTHEPLRLNVSLDGPDPEPCVIHFAVPAARWWQDIVFT